jgi:hypothetical protein
VVSTGLFQGFSGAGRARDQPVAAERVRRRLDAHYDTRDLVEMKAGQF